MPSNRKRYVLYKTDEWNHPIYWQWFSVSASHQVDWAKQTHFCVLFSDFNKWEAVHDSDSTNTKIDNMKFISGFESKIFAIDSGRKRGWLKNARARQPKKKAA